MEYLLKSALLSALLFAFYKVFLQKDTFFSANRIFFLLGIGIAFLLPLLIIPIKKEVFVPKTPQLFTQITPTFNETISDELVFSQSINSIDWSQLILYLYAIGVIILSLKFIIELLSLAYLIYHNPKERNEESIFVKTQKQLAPFSFFIWIVFNKNLFTKHELKQIIKHEKVHVTHWHSVDLLLAQFLTILQWFNPFVWLYKKELQQNLEYIADQKANEKESNLKDYQYLLLKTSIGKDPFALTNNFFNSHLKKRIIMLQKSKTNRFHQFKYILIIPILAVFLYSFNTKEVYIVKHEKSTETIQVNKQKTISFITPIDKNKLKQISGYGTRIHPILKIKRMHYGIDFSAAKGTPVVSSAEGIVIEAKTTKTLGKIVRIEHADGYQTNYYHLDEINTKKGMRVKSGEVIGKVGSTGESVAPHLHFEMLKDKKYVNPKDYLPMTKQSIKASKESLKKKISKIEKVQYKKIINKNTTDSYLKEVTAFYKNLGFDVNFSLVKRNAKNEITGIFVNIKSENSETSYHFDSDTAIKAFYLDYNPDTKQITINNVNEKDPVVHITKDNQSKTKTITITKNTNGSNSYSYSVNDEILYDSIINRKVVVISDSFPNATLATIQFDSIKGKEFNWTGTGKNALTINIDEETGVKTFQFNGKEFSEEDFLNLNESNIEFIKIEDCEDSDLSQLNFDNDKNEKDLKEIEKRLKRHEKELKKREKKLLKRLKKREKELKKREKELLKREKELKKKNAEKVSSFFHEGKQYFNVKNEYYDQFGNRITGKLEQKLIKKNKV